MPCPPKPRPRRRLPGLPRNGDAGPPHARNLRTPTPRQKTTKSSGASAASSSASTASPSAPSASKSKPSPPLSTCAGSSNWQHLAPQTQLSGEEGVLEALQQLEGFEAPAIEWERTLLPARVANYDPRWLDALCLSGAVGWGRVSPHPGLVVADGAAPRRVIPTNAAPITFYIRESADWLPHALAQQSVEESKLAAALSPEALHVRALLQQRGACFSNDIQRIANLTRPNPARPLGTRHRRPRRRRRLRPAPHHDGPPPQARHHRNPQTNAPTRSSAGRWSLLNEADPAF